MNAITITLDGGTQIRCSAGTRVGDILSQRRSPEGYDYVGALVNNDAVSLTYPVEVDTNITLLNIQTMAMRRP